MICLANSHHSRHYRAILPWFQKDLKLFCCCIARAKRHYTRDLDSQQLPRAIDSSSKADIASDIVREVTQSTADIARTVMKQFDDEGRKDESVFGPSRLQRYGHGGSLPRLRVNTVVSVSTES